MDPTIAVRLGFFLGSILGLLLGLQVPRIADLWER